MRFLAIDTAGPSVQAVLSAGAYFHDGNGKNASAALMPAIDGLLHKADMRLRDLDFLACVVGPGSFTGIRIGVSAARAVCYACGLPALPLHYLQTLAYNERADGSGRILCVTDGSNGTAYSAEYDGNRREVSPCRCVDKDQAVAAAKAFDGAVCVDEKAAVWLPQAIVPAADGKTLLRAAAALYENTVSWQELVPVYVRVSQAEQDLAKKEGRIDLS
ncbi:MAG: tRNA (adenosine(37)-N6)-threonylcarbamoyltransferase complex dimerization subunit type 1 TsaB [Clostridia bacterium]|nr:tRNA (adenosine(37)-N6)-threonylcarbamoyltransferase complex dimerization subunit type 1 TsaB [Clostridia bacterium]